MEVLYPGMTRKQRKNYKMEFKKNAANDGKVIDTSVRGCNKLAMANQELFKSIKNEAPARFNKRAKRYARIYAQFNI